MGKERQEVREKEDEEERRGEGVVGYGERRMGGDMREKAEGKKWKILGKGEAK